MSTENERGGSQQQAGSASLNLEPAAGSGESRGLVGAGGVRPEFNEKHALQYDPWGCDDGEMRILQDCANDLEREWAGEAPNSIEAAIAAASSRVERGPVECVCVMECVSVVRRAAQPVIVETVSPAVTDDDLPED